LVVVRNGKLIVKVFDDAGTDFSRDVNYKERVTVNNGFIGVYDHEFLTIYDDTLRQIFRRISVPKDFYITYINIYNENTIELVDTRNDYLTTDLIVLIDRV
jgi:hypothetical protein